jgi:hypothetical protein
MRREAYRRLDLLAPDTRERHLIVASLLGAPTGVLDVGGVPRQLSAVLPPDTPCVAANTELPADFLIPVGPLPFTDRCVPAVASLDVLEHVAALNRSLFVSELLRVAENRVVLSCPYGSLDHVQAEKDIADWLWSRTGERNRWLDEHIQNNLPNESELRDLFATADFTVEFFYHGDFRETMRMFKRDVQAQERGQTTRTYAAWARARLDTKLAVRPMRYTNRAFVRATRA